MSGPGAPHSVPPPCRHCASSWRGSCQGIDQAKCTPVNLLNVGYLSTAPEHLLLVLLATSARGWLVVEWRRLTERQLNWAAADKPN